MSHYSYFIDGSGMYMYNTELMRSLSHFAQLTALTDCNMDLLESELGSYFMHTHVQLVSIQIKIY